MTAKSYPATMTLAEARALFFKRSGLGEDGGYNARWVRVETKPFAVYFPNTASRVEAAKLHDLHHIANEYATDWSGEAEIGGWEIASGCGRYGWAWILNLGAFAVGMALFPKRLYRAFVRGRHAGNLYHENFAEEKLMLKTVDWLRQRVRVSGGEPEASVSDKFAFVFWCGLAIGYHACWAVAGLAVIWSLLRFYSR